VKARLSLMPKRFGAGIVNKYRKCMSADQQPTFYLRTQTMLTVGIRIAAQVITGSAGVRMVTLKELQ
jgi:hypothetical protein